MSQFDPTFPSAQGTYSFFFGGVGDARHFFATVVTIAQHEAKKTELSQPNSKYHFTINDIKPHTTARNLLVLLLMNQLAISEHDKQTTTDIVALIFFIFLGVLIPARVHGHLLEIIDKAREILTTPSLIPPWLWISQRDCAKIIQVLDSWKEPMFPVTHAQAQISRAEGVMPKGERPKGCEREFTAYRRTGALFPPWANMQFESELKWFLAGGPGVGGPGIAAWEAGLRAYVGREWKVNMTMVDKEWCRE